MLVIATMCLIHKGVSMIGLSFVKNVSTNCTLKVNTDSAWELFALKNWPFLEYCVFC